jgi:hypothetical protein
MKVITSAVVDYHFFNFAKKISEFLRYFNQFVSIDKSREKCCVF